MNDTAHHKKLVANALKYLPKKVNALEKEMVAMMASAISEEDLEYFDPELLADMVEAHWGMSKSRHKGEPKISIYCPVTEDSRHRKTFIDIVSGDLAFLIDSVVAEINRHNLLIDLLIHPVLYTEYDKKGNLKKLQDKRDRSLLPQSHIHIQIKETLADEVLKELEQGLYTAMEDVFFANKDWKKMLERIKDSRDDLANAPIKRPLREIEQYCAFLDYVYDNNFTLLGYREYEFVERGGKIVSKTIKGRGLGVLNDEMKPAYISETEEGLPMNLQELRHRLDPVSISKTNRISTVHRRVPMDAIAIKTYNSKGKVVGEKLFLGLFTSVTYSRSVMSIPYLREKIEGTMEASGFIPGSHDRKALRHILEKYPRDELFQMSSKQLLDISLNILRLQERQRISLFMRPDPFGRYVSCLVYVPRDRFSSDLRKKMAAILEEKLSGKLGNFYTTLDDSVFARVMFVLNISQNTPPKYNKDDIEAKLQEAGQTWSERLNDALIDNLDQESRINLLSDKYGEAFPVAYTEHYRAMQAVFDIEKVETALSQNSLQIDLYRSAETQDHQMRLKLYNPAAPVTLSDVMPILENMGLRAIAELPFEINPDGEDKSVWIHDFLLEMSNCDTKVVIKDIKKNFERAFIKTWYRGMENDGLNRLVASANMNWHEITILRTYVRYLKQIGYPFSRQYVEQALTLNPKISRVLVDMFKAFHDPENGDTSQEKAAGCALAIDHALQEVDSLDQDRILRSMTNLIEATMRTNYYQRQEDGGAKTYLSIKLASTQIKDLPKPKPYMEIFVYSPRVEAVHLRGGPIARGGLRWSDRHEDFRTEVLGLMKAQMVKNAVIVPVGSKGGFVVKTKSLGRDEFFEEGVKCYKIFIRGLLDITDNLSAAGKVLPPENVVRRDGDDPYLVVAADKGTATFSDVANGLSQEYGFWLGDAFASGGSAGYDHKKMGITARGAWESVKMHFRQLDHNTQEQPFDVVGVGDMGGDVFGNGMLLSKHIRLIGGFNHLHIFCDPDPDTAKSYKERKRLFDKVGGWDQYNTKLLSKGGRIYSRADKVLELTPEIRKRFDIEESRVSPIELIRAMLRSRTDLLWFGGIGTYIKSSKETNADAGDKANDALRINAIELRARVIGEGANLATTQAGRIEFTENGGRINTDFIDNSAGVDSSDHEVNIKILMTDIMAQKKHKMDIKGRNKLLEKMTDEVADLCLRSNYQQAQAISLIELQARERLQIQDEFIRDLEREQGFDRALEGLPDAEEIERRLRLGKGLTRPELSILLSYAKINFTNELLDSDIPDNPDMLEWIRGYFPEILQKKYAPEIDRHKLRREIVATTMSNSLVNRMGPTFLKSRMKKTGASPANIAKAYIIVREAFGLRALWDQIEGLDNKVPSEVQMKAMREIALLSEHAITWFLTRLGRDPDISADIKAFGKGIKNLSDNIEEIITDAQKKSIEEHVHVLVLEGLPEDLAKQIALMPGLSSACDIIRISLEQKTNLINTSRSYFELGERFHIGWLRESARFIHSEDHWTTEATNGVVDQLFGVQARLTARVLRETNNGRSKKDDSAVEKWIDDHPDILAQIDPLFVDLKRSQNIELPMLIIAEQRLRNISN